MFILIGATIYLIRAWELLINSRGWIAENSLLSARTIIENRVDDSKSPFLNRSRKQREVFMVFIFYNSVKSKLLNKPAYFSPLYQPKIY